FGGYFSFLYEHDELEEDEKRVFQRHHEWLKKVESETMTKSYKMVVLQFILNQEDHWISSVTPEEIAPYFHNFYMEKNYRKYIDFSSKTNKAMWDYDEKKIARLVTTMPIKHLQGKDALMKFEDNKFGIAFEVAKEDN